MLKIIMNFLKFFLILRFSKKRVADFVKKLKII
jgi:hypothetical protein